MMGHLADVINRAKFYLNQIRCFNSVGGSNFWLFHRKEKSPLTQGLNYRSACDDELVRFSSLWIGESLWNSSVYLTIR